MPNPIYQAMGGGNTINAMQMLQSFKQNPMQFLMRNRLNVPQDIANDPNAIISHLLQTGQVNQEAVNRAYQMAQRWNG